MALINCPKCGKEISDRELSCPNCGCSITSHAQQVSTEKVTISFPENSGQIFFIGCYVYDEYDNKIVECEQGETVSFDCNREMKVTIKMRMVGKTTQVVTPGRKYMVKINSDGFGIYVIDSRDEWKEWEKIRKKIKPVSQQNVIHCPTCNSTNVSKISGVSKATKAAMFGVFSLGSISKTFKCNNCGYKW